MKRMSKERHPNVVRTYGVVDIVHLMIVGVVMEVCTGSLANTIAQNDFTPAPMDTVAEFMRQILMGLAFLHAKKIIHRCPVVHASHDPVRLLTGCFPCRDLKPSNILMSPDTWNRMRLKLADFGLSKILPGETSSMTAGVGTKAFLAPEVEGGKSYDFSADVWSAGIVAYQLGTGGYPDKGKKN